MYQQINDRCIFQKPPSYVTEAVIAEQEAFFANSGNISIHYKSKSPISLSPTAKNPYESPLSIIDEDGISPSKLPMFTNKNELLSTQEDSPLMQAVMKVPTEEPGKRLPVSNRKDGDPNETIGVDELTANLHANDQPVYKIVTQPSVEKKTNKKTGSSKEQGSGGRPYKTGHQKKSSLKGMRIIFLIVHVVKCILDARRV